MKKIVVCGIVLVASLGSAFAAEPVNPPGTAVSGASALNTPVGEWIVEDAVARIRIVDCNSRLWGVIAWEKEPGIDSENPDRSKKTRPTLGMPILLNMKKTPADNRGDPDQWEGKVYNAENGKLYDSKIKLISADKLELKGCVLGFLCGGQTWTRFIDPAVSQTPPMGAIPPKSNVAKTKLPATAGAAKGTPAPAVTGAPKGVPAADPATTEICSLPEIAGAPH